MGLRLVGKSIILAMRSKRRFIVFSLMYTTLMAWMSWNFQEFIFAGQDATRNLLLLLISIGSTLILSVLYAFIIINYRKQEIATLKCIGYTNTNIRTIIIGELVWVTFVAFIFVIEALIHVTAFTTYLADISGGSSSETITVNAPILSIWPILITLLMFLLSQILGILAIYKRILNLRPIVALRVIK